MKDIIHIGLVKETKNKEEVKKIMKRKEETKILNTLIAGVLGNFFLHFYNSIPSGVERQYKFRFIYLCCYLKHDDNRLVYKKDNGRYELIKEVELMQLLKLKSSEYYKTRKVLIENKLIKIDAENNIHINNNISIVGKVNKCNNNYTRTFKDGIKDLYENASIKEHKRLALFIELMPYIHYDYNIVCKNPNCELWENVDPFSIKELTELFNNYTNKNSTTFKKQLLNTFVGGNPIIAIVEKYNKKFLTINPAIYYNGNKLDTLESLIGIFKI